MNPTRFSIVLLFLLALAFNACDLGVGDPTEAELRDQINNTWTEQSDVIQDDLLPIDVITEPEALASFKAEMDSNELLHEDGYATHYLVRFCSGETVYEDSILYLLESRTLLSDYMLSALGERNCNAVKESEAIANSYNKLLLDGEYRSQVLDQMAFSNIQASESALITLWDEVYLDPYQKCLFFLATSKEPKTTVPLLNIEGVLGSSESYEMADWILGEAFQNYFLKGNNNHKAVAFRIVHNRLTNFHPDYDEENWSIYFQTLCTYENPDVAAFIRQTIDSVDMTYRSTELKMGLMVVGAVEGEGALDLIDDHKGFLSPEDLLDVYVATAKNLKGTSDQTTKTFVEHMRLSGIFSTFRTARDAMEIIRAMDTDAPYDDYKSLFAHLQKTGAGNMRLYWDLYDLTSQDLVNDMVRLGMIDQAPSANELLVLAKRYGDHASNPETILQFLEHYVSSGTVSAASSSDLSDYHSLLQYEVIPICTDFSAPVKIRVSTTEETRGTRYSVRMLANEKGYMFATYDEESTYNLPLVKRAVNKMLIENGKEKRLMQLQRNDGQTIYYYVPPTAFQEFAKKYQLRLSPL